MTGFVLQGHIYLIESVQNSDLMHFLDKLHPIFNQSINQSINQPITNERHIIDHRPLIWLEYMSNIYTTHVFKGIVHFEIKIWYLSAYPKGIQDVGVFFSSVDQILMFLGQTVLVCQSYNGRYRSLSL